MVDELRRERVRRRAGLPSAAAGTHACFCMHAAPRMHAVRRTRRMHAALAAHAAHLPSKRMATRRCALEQVHARELLVCSTSVLSCLLETAMAASPRG